MLNRFPNRHWLWLTAAVMVLDQISKQWIVKNLEWFEARPLWPSLNIVHHRNTGVAFSMFNEAPQVAFVLLGVAVSVGILWWLRKNPRGQTLVAAGLTLIMGGALGNLVDRVTRGYVVDFIDFYVGSWHYATFNIADSAISVGAGLLILDLLLDWRRQQG